MLHKEFTSKGDLTLYALCCGCVQKGANGAALYHEHGCYHICNEAGLWAVEGSLSAVRKIFKQACKGVKQ